MKYGKLLFLLLVCILLTGCTPQPAGNTPATTESTEAQQVTAPDFTVYDEAGKAYRLSDFFGKPIILNFWASWCGPCKSEMPDFDEAYDTYGEKIHFLMINLTDGKQETVASAAGFIKNAGYGFPVYFDTASEAAATYGIRSIPTTYFIDANGYCVAYGTGALDMQSLQRGIDMILP